MIEQTSVIYEKIEVGAIESKSQRAGVTLEWSNIQLKVGSGDKEKTLLHTMAGVARPQQMLAVMGSSGAGKSTLLDVLAGRLETSGLKGTITSNGNIIEKKNFRRETGYVMQSDALFPLLTVRETFLFAAYLRVQDKTKAEKVAAVDKIIHLLRLEKCAGTIVGDELNRGLSGGEKRRVSIGVDIVHEPAVVFLDEPTSGLDSSTALSVVESLKAIAVEATCTVVMTIHQPSAKLFASFDSVIFLAAGRVTYDGPTKDLLAYIGDVYKAANYGVPPVANPPELFLDLTDRLATDNNLVLVTGKYDGDSSRNVDNNISEPNSQVSYANSLLGECGILLNRALLNMWRTKELFLARMGAVVFFGVLIGTLFKQTGKDKVDINYDLQTSYFVFTIAFFYYTSLEALPIFLAEREIFQREYSRGAYRALSYVLATTLVNFPFMLIIAFLYSIITYWLVGLPNIAGVFFFNVLTVFTVLITGTSFATMFSVLVPNPMVGQTAGSGLFSVMFLFSGFFIKKADIPDYWIWLYYLSLFNYAYDAFLVNAFKFGDAMTADLSNNDILIRYSVNGVNRGLGIGILWGFIVVFRFVFYYRLTTAFNGSRK
mmetsp:Transcript_34172/g.49668  ORF Transcript_34172/g.49668 Transcript_34172/m.49668 type:complete len:600 (+) Transcript_34172:44-1843(+)